MGKLRTLLATAAGGLALAGCAEAGAEDKKAPETAEFTKLAAVVETAEDIKKRCRLLSHETEVQKATKKACYAEVKALRQSEIAAKTEELAKIDTTTEVLTRLNEVAREEFEKEVRPQN